MQSLRVAGIVIITVTAFFNLWQAELAKMYLKKALETGLAFPVLPFEKL